MIYKAFQDLKLSALGMGCMRLPVVDGKDDQVDQAAVEEMVAYAMSNGVNYYDTAWGYHSGNSELAIGKALAAYPRESFYLADKFPGYDLSNMDKVRDIFPKQRQKNAGALIHGVTIHGFFFVKIPAHTDVLGASPWEQEIDAAGRAFPGSFHKSFLPPPILQIRQER